MSTASRTLPRRISSIYPHRYLKTMELTNGAKILTWTVSPTSHYFKSTKDTYNSPLYNPRQPMEEEAGRVTQFQSKFKLDSTWKPSTNSFTNSFNVQEVKVQHRKKRSKDQEQDQEGGGEELGGKKTK